MTLGTMTWTCLLLSAAAAQPDVWQMNQKAFQIPIRFDAQKRAEIKELDLYVSHDQGQTWNLAGRATPDKEYFPYAVTEDGPYWFTMAVIDQKGHQEPANIAAAPVGQRILVDTVRPDIQMEVDRRADKVRVHWAITEEHPKPESLKLEFAETVDGPWTSVPVKPGPTGEAEFPYPSAVVVRMQMTDMAENLGQAIKPIGPANVGTAFTAPPPPLVGAPAPPGVGALPPPAPVPSDLAGSPTPDHPDGASKWKDRPNDAPPPGTLTTSVPPPPAPPSPSATDMVPLPPPPAPGPVASRGTGNQVVAFSPSSVGAGPPAAGALLTNPDAPPSGRGDMPPVQIVNKRQVKLDFDVGKFGPSGLGGVDVYVTADDGATWQQAAVDPKGTTLPQADLRSGEAVRGSVAVLLPNEGVTYGYYVVVKSRAGLGKPAPRGGDQPQIRVELDATPPEAVLIKPEADPTPRDTLVLQWKAKDKHLTGTPITLEWSAQGGPDAQWNPIGPAELENSCRYEWQPTPDVPPNVFLRMTVRDTAGNRSVAQTPKPVLIDLSVPEVTNIGLSGVGLNVDQR